MLTDKEIGNLISLFLMITMISITLICIGSISLKSGCNPSIQQNCQNYDYFTGIIKENYIVNYTCYDCVESFHLRSLQQNRIRKLVCLTYNEKSCYGYYSKFSHGEKYCDMQLGTDYNIYSYDIFSNKGYIVNNSELIIVNKKDPTTCLTESNKKNIMKHSSQGLIMIIMGLLCPEIGILILLYLMILFLIKKIHISLYPPYLREVIPRRDTLTVDIQIVDLSIDLTPVKEDLLTQMTQIKTEDTIYIKRENTNKII
jgi:hypothetical protein